MSTLEVQQLLTRAGFDPGKHDGVWGNATRSALTAALAIAAEHRPRPPAPVQSDLQNAKAVDRIIDQGMALLPKIRDTEESRVLLIAIAGQEANFTHRWQVVDRAKPEAMGPARGLWQFERGGSVRGVLTHERTRTLAESACRKRGIAPTIDAVYAALHRDDVLAAAFARLNLLWYPKPLPAVTDTERAFGQYIEIWRPGAWFRGTTSQREALRRKWAGYHATAREARKVP